MQASADLALAVRARAALELRRRRGEVRTETFREYVDRVHPKFVWYDHCVRIAAVLQRFADEPNFDRLMVLMPPRHGKSELISRLFSAYFLRRYPDRWVGLASYAAALAYKLSRASRDFARLGGVQLRDDAEAVAEWETTRGGGLWAAGVGGPATGKGMHLGILDDAVKNAEEAQSEVIADRNRDWWASTWYTRQEPGGKLLVVTTRWPGAADIVDYLLSQETADDQPERWHVVCFEAEKLAEPLEVPATCTLEPDPREIGAALCPERYPLEKLRRLAARIGSFFYQSLFQQRRTQREGKMFKWGWWQVLPAVPSCTRYVRYWDLAGTEPRKKGHDPDYTASVLAGRMPDDRTAFLDVQAFRESIAQRDALIESTALADYRTHGHAVAQWIEQEAGIGGQERTEALIRRLQRHGITVHTEPATGSKLLRAEPLAAAAEAGNVVLAPDPSHTPWHDRFRTHMGEFSPNCDHDDIADAASGAFNKIALPPQTGVRIATTSFG